MLGFPDHTGERRQGPPSLGVGGWLCKEIAAKAWVMLLLVTAYTAAIKRTWGMFRESTNDFFPSG